MEVRLPPDPGLDGSFHAYKFRWSEPVPCRRRYCRSAAGASSRWSRPALPGREGGQQGLRRQVVTSATTRWAGSTGTRCRPARQVGPPSTGTVHLFDGNCPVAGPATARSGAVTGRRRGRPRPWRRIRRRRAGGRGWSSAALGAGHGCGGGARRAQPPAWPRSASVRSCRPFPAWSAGQAAGVAEVGKSEGAGMDSWSILGDTRITKMHHESIPAGQCNPPSRTCDVIPGSRHMYVKLISAWDYGAAPRGPDRAGTGR